MWALFRLSTPNSNWVRLTMKPKWNLFGEKSLIVTSIRLLSHWFKWCPHTGFTSLPKHQYKAAVSINNSLRASRSITSHMLCLLCRTTANCSHCTWWQCTCVVTYAWRNSLSLLVQGMWWWWWWYIYLLLSTPTDCHPRQVTVRVDHL